MTSFFHWRSASKSTSRATGLQQLFHEWHSCVSYKLCMVRFAWLGRFSVATGDCQRNEKGNENRQQGLQNRDLKACLLTYFFTMIKDKKRAHFMASISIMIANWAWWTCAPSYHSVSRIFFSPQRKQTAPRPVWEYFVVSFGYNIFCCYNLQFRTLILNWQWLFLNSVHAFSLFRILLKEIQERFKEFTQT